MSTARGIGTSALSGAAMALPRPHMVSQATFVAYMIFTIDFFMHITNRIPAMWKFRPTLLLVVIIGGMLLAQVEILKERGMSPMLKALLVLIAYIFLSIPAVQFPGSVIRYHIPAFVKAVVFFFFTAYIIDSPKRLKIFLNIFIFTQVFRVLEPLYLNIFFGYWGDSTHMGHGEFANRLGGAPADIINSNELGFVIVTIIPFLHYLVAPRGWKGRLTYFALLPLLLYALILTMSRGSFLVLLVVGYFVFRESRHKPLLIVVAIVIAGLGWASMSDVQRDRYLSIVGMSDTENERTSEGRIRGIVTEFEIGLKRPIFGYGLGTTPEAKVHNGHHPAASHNLYAQLMIEIGFIGGVLFLRFLYLAYRSLAEMKRRRRGPPHPDEAYFARLNQTLTVIFFMYAVYSINYWGLSQYYWYNFAGLTFAFGRIKSLVDQRALAMAEARTADGRIARPR